jgi:Recombination endonuclease VII
MKTKTKRCTKCGKRRPVTQFHREKSGAYKSWCKECLNGQRRQNLGRHRLVQIRRRYGISTQEYHERLVLKQRFECHICGTDLSRTAVHVDHCHITKKVRGFLCNACNRGIGMLKDDPELVLRAWRYLSNFEMEHLPPLLEPHESVAEWLAAVEQSEWEKIVDKAL